MTEQYPPDAQGLSDAVVAILKTVTPSTGYHAMVTIRDLGYAPGTAFEMVDAAIQRKLAKQEPQS